MAIDDEQSEMTVPRPALRYEFNLNTIIQVVGFLAMIWVGGQAWGGLDNRVKSLEDAGKARDIRITNVEADVRKYDNLQYRITIVEQANASVAKSLEDLKSSVSDLSGDTKVMREILQRLESKASPALLRPSIAQQ